MRLDVPETRLSLVDPDRTISDNVSILPLSLDAMIVRAKGGDGPEKRSNVFHRRMVAE